jgi:HD-like signal output (HDOD) protein
VDSHLNTTLPPPQLDEGFLSDHFNLPPLPAVVSNLLEKIHCGQANAHEVAEILSADPGLVAQILKIVNSAYYSLPHRITEAKHAVAYLGLAEIERLAVAATVMKELAPANSEQFERFWFHSFYATLISKRLACEFASRIDAGELHTAVLLHDIGKLVYMKFFPDHYQELSAHCQSNGVLLIDAERALNYPSHQEFGLVLCDRWNLPETVKRACRRHEMEELERLDETHPYCEEIRLICLANLLSNLARETLGPEQKNSIRKATTRALGCTDQDFLLLMGEIYELKSEVESFLRQL